MKSLDENVILTDEQTAWKKECMSWVEQQIFARRIQKEEKKSYDLTHSDNKAEKEKKKKPVLAELVRNRKLELPEDVFASYYSNSMFIRNLYYPLSKNACGIPTVMEQEKQSWLSKSEELLSNQPLVSVIYVADILQPDYDLTMACMIDQSYTNCEFIVVTTKRKKIKEELTPDIIGKWKIIMVEEEVPMAERYNMALKKAKGQYLAFARSGAFWNFDYLRVSVSVLEEQKDAVAVYSAQDIVKGRNHDKFRLHFSAFTLASIENKNDVSVTAYVCRKALLDQIGYMREDLPVDSYLDDFIVRCAHKGRIVSLPVVLGIIRYNIWRNEMRLADRTSLVQKEDEELIELDYTEEQSIIKENAKGVVATELKRLDLAAENPIVLEELKTRSAKYPYYHLNREMLSVVSLSEAFGKGKKAPLIWIENVTNVADIKACVASIHAFTPKDYNYKIHIDPVWRAAANLKAVGAFEQFDEKTSTSEVEQYISEIKTEPWYYEARGYDGDIVLLNGNALVTEKWLDALYQVTEQVEAAGVVVARQQMTPTFDASIIDIPIKNPDREYDLALQCWAQNIDSLKKYDTKGYATLYFADKHAMLITQECQKKIGFTFEDSQAFGKAVREQGYEMVYTPFSKVYQMK